MKTLVTAFAAGAMLLAAPVQAQDQEGASSSAAAPQSQALSDMETKLWGDVTTGDGAYDKVNDAINAKAEASAICPDLQTAYTAYSSASRQFQDVLNAIDADTVLPDAAKPGERSAVNGLWEEIDYYLYDIEDLGETYGCGLT